MNSLVTGTANLNLSKPDAGGNFGYFLTFNFKYQEDNHEGTIKMGSGVAH